METKPTYEELIMGERRFLHDMANHLVVAQGMLGIAMKGIKDSNVSDKDKERLQKSFDAVNKMTESLKGRRSHLHTISES